MYIKVYIISIYFPPKRISKTEKRIDTSMCDITNNIARMLYNAYYLSQKAFDFIWNGDVLKQFLDKSV